MKPTSLFFSLMLILSLKAQKLTIIGDFNKINYKICSSVLNPKNISIKQVKTGSNKGIKIKQFLPEFINNSNVTNTEFTQTINNYIKSTSDINNNLVFVTINNPNNSTVEKIVGNTNTIIGITEFSNNFKKYKKTNNILLLLPSLIETKKIKPSNQSSISNYNFKLHINGFSCYKLDSVIVTMQNLKITLPKKDISGWNTTTGEFTINSILQTTDISINNDLNIQITFKDINGVSFFENINELSIQKAYINSTLSDLGEVDPRTKSFIAYYHVSVKSNIDMNTVEIEYFDKNKKTYPNAMMESKATVIPCGAGNEKIILINPYESAVAYVLNSNDSNSVYSSLISTYNTKHALCGYNWEGYIKIRYPGSEISTDFIKMKLPGFDASKGTELDIIECY